MSAELSRPGHERQFQRLIRTVQRARGGSTWFVVGRGIEVRDEVVDRLCAELTGTHQVRLVELPGGTKRPFDQLALAAESAEAVPVLVAWCAPSARGERADAPFWQDLNLGREARGRGGWHLLIWVAGLEGLAGVRDAAPDLWAHRSGLILAITAEDFAAPAEERAVKDLPTRAARIDELIGSASVSENELASVLRTGHSMLGAQNPLYSGALVRLVTGNPLVHPEIAALALYDHATSAGGPSAASRYGTTLRLSNGAPIPPGSENNRQTWQLRRAWLRQWGRRIPTVSTSVLVNLVAQASNAGRVDVAAGVLAEALRAIADAGDPAFERHNFPLVAARQAFLSAQRWQTVEALEGLHVSVARYVAGLDWGVDPARLAATLYAALGQPADADTVIDAARLSPLHRLSAWTSAIEAGCTGSEASISLDIGAALEDIVTTSVAWAGGHPRLRARTYLAAAEALLQLGGDHVGRALSLLDEVDSLPSSVPLLPPIDALNRLERTAADPIERGLAVLRDRVVRRSGSRTLAEALPGLPSGLEASILPIEDVRAAAWSLRAKILASQGEWNRALELDAMAEDAFSRLGATASQLPVALHAASVLLDQGEVDLAVECLTRIDEVLEGERSPEIDLRPLSLLVEAAAQRSRAALAEGRPTDAHRLMQAAGETCFAAGNAEQEFEVLLEIAGLPAVAASWEERVEAAQRAMAMASEASLLVAEGRALVAWSRLLTEAQRDDEAQSALAAARWIRDRCPAKRLVEAFDR